MELLFSIITNVLDLTNTTQPQQSLVWLIPLIIGGIVASFTILIAGSVNKDTKNIVILGAKYSGKTTLWNQLRGKKNSNSYEGTDKNNINSFTIKTKNGIKRKVSNSVDIGGGDTWVENYDKLINENDTFIFYLIDLPRAKEKKREVRARLFKILKIIEEKKLEGCGIKIIGTFLDMYKTYSTTNANSYLRELLDLNSISSDLKKVEIISVNLLNNNDIERIKQEITK